MAITFIAGSAQFLSAASGTIATPGTLNVATGDLVVVGIRQVDSSARVTGVTDTAGNVYRLAGYQKLATINAFEVWYCFNCVANATNTVTATYSASVSSRSIAAVQFRSVAVASPLDVNVSAFVATANIASPAYTTTVANAVLVAFGQINSITSTWTVTVGWTEAIRDADDVCMVQYLVVSAIQTAQTVTMVNDTATNKSIVVLSFHETIAGGGGGEHSSVL